MNARGALLGCESLHCGLAATSRGSTRAKAYVEGLVAKLLSPDLVVLLELALCSYIASQKA